MRTRQLCLLNQAWLVSIANRAGGPESGGEKERAKPCRKESCQECFSLLGAVAWNGRGRTDEFHGELNVTFHAQLLSPSPKPKGAFCGAVNRITFKMMESASSYRPISQSPEPSLKPPSVSAPPRETLTGSAEAVTSHNEDNGFAVLKVKARGKRDLVPVVGHVASISVGEFIHAVGVWIIDRTHGIQFKSDFLKTTPPTTAVGIVKYLGSGMVRGIRAFGEGTFEIIEASPEEVLIGLLVRCDCPLLVSVDYAFG